METFVSVCVMLVAFGPLIGIVALAWVEEYRRKHSLPPVFPHPTLQESLEALGSTKEEVADTLFTRGFRGRQGLATQCPVAHYLQALGFKGVLVTTDVVYGNGCKLGSAEVPAVTAFNRAFDENVFPNLEEK